MCVNVCVFASQIVKDSCLWLRPFSQSKPLLNFLCVPNMAIYLTLFSMFLTQLNLFVSST